jgi:uncharacterized BrkB/YihY/UPF0761 family membrane protein
MKFSKCNSMSYAIKNSISRFSSDDCMTHAAALAFYTLFALPPLLFLLVLNEALSLLTSWAFFTATFRWMPDARVSWTHAFLGGLLTVILFTIGRTALYFYLSMSSPAAQLGSAAGSLVVILLWVFYSSSILLLGAEFTASLTPFDIVPEPGAVRMEESTTPMSQETNVDASRGIVASSR